MRRIVLALLLATSACKGGCARGEPPPTVDHVHIEVERGGKTILIERLEAPDLIDPEWRVWRLKSLVPQSTPGEPIDVIDDEGFRSPLLRVGELPGDTEPLLLLGPDGETRAVRVERHGALTAHQGNARKDAGRIRHVAKLVFVDGDAGVVGPAISLKVVGGGKDATWTRADLNKVDPIVLMSKDGDGERDAWSLRKLVAPSTVVEAVGEGGKTMKIDDAQWRDDAILPVLRSNRRGRLKLVWLDAKTHEEDKDAEQLRGVTEIRVGAP